jgi:hypothetical protein
VASLLPIAPAHGATTREADVASYQQLLNDYLTTTSKPGDPLETRFDYEELFISSGRDARLMRIRTDLLQVPPSEMTPKARMAWAIDTYNYLVLESVTQNLYEKRIVRGKLDGRRSYVRRGRSTVRQIPDFFTSNVVSIEGRDYSLNAFEQHFLFGDFTRGGSGKAPKDLDPRIHFALVCGAVGCPPLQPRAYRADSLELQLEAATRNALASPNHLRYVAELQRLEMSQIFTWYAADFGGPEDVWEFVLRYAPPEMKKLMSQRKTKTADGAIPWEWNMNQTSMTGRVPTIIRGNVSP